MDLYTEEGLIKLKQAQDATNHARETTKTAQKTAQQLERKLQKLQKEHDKCKAALRAARAAEEDAYTRYAQAISKSFTTALLSALPRELRDHVYSYLWDDEDIVRQTKRSVREYAWSYRMPEFCAPAYVQPDHVGLVVAEELALSVYKKAFGTKLHVTVSAGHLHKFLAANPLRSHLKPADSIRALDIEWYPNEYSDKDVARSFGDLAHYGFLEPIPVKLILGKFLGGAEGIPQTTSALAAQLNVFKSAYDALVRGGCPVMIESLSGNDAEVDFFASS